MDIAKRFPQLPEGVLRRMCSMLPPPQPDTLENRERFRQGAINAFIALDPFDIFDAMAAKSIIISEAQAWACAENARKPDLDIKLAARWRSLADDHLRLAQSMRRDIDRRRAKRLKDAQRKAATAKREWWPLVLTPAGVSFRNRPQRQPMTQEQKAARIRALRLHLVEAPPTRH